MIFRQFFDPDSSTYTYLIGDRDSGSALLIDTTFPNVDRDRQFIEELGLQLKYCLETHIHADHITGAGQLRKHTGCHILVPSPSAAKNADGTIGDGEELNLGKQKIRVIATPGHTDTCQCYLLNESLVFTGDTLLIRGCGRTDFQSGSPETLYDSITTRLFTLPDEVLVYPGHDYKGRTASSIGEEKRFNPRLAGKSKAEFVDIMNNLNLALPKRIKESVPANLTCGLMDEQPSP